MANTRAFIWAHRGASGYEPENTMAAFKRAIELGADGVETDAFLTADDVVVLSHDGKLKRDGTRVDIRSLSYEEIQHMPPYQAIPTYRALVDLCLPRKMPISVDVRDMATAQGLLRINVESQAIPIVDVCFDTTQNLKKARDLSEASNLVFSPGYGWSPQYAVDLLSENLPDFVDWRVKAVNFQWRYYTENPELLPLVHDKGKMLAYAWDVHKRDVMETVAGIPFDALYSNYPDQLKGVLDTKVLPGTSTNEI